MCSLTVLINMICQIIIIHGTCVLHHARNLFRINLLALAEGEDNSESQDVEQMYVLSFIFYIL